MPLDSSAAHRLIVVAALFAAGCVSKPAVAPVEMENPAEAGFLSATRLALRRFASSSDEA